MTAPLSPSFSPRPAAPEPFDTLGLLMFRPRRQHWPALAFYAVGFAVLHRMAAYWGGSGFYSLWFPAAGLRLALLWRLGPRLTPAIALVEIAVDVTLTPAVLAGVPWTVSSSRRPTAQAQPR